MNFSQKVALGLVQMRCEDDPQVNLEKALESIRQLAAQGAQVICLPELFKSHYFCQSEETKNFALAEKIPGPTTDVLAKLAKELKVTLIVSLFEKRAEGIYHNTTVTLGSEGDLLSQYRKMHIPDDPYYYEKFYFTPGDMGFKSFSTPHGKMGSLVCWDQWYPEAARLTALSGSRVIFYPTAIAWIEGEDEAENRTQYQAWETIQRSHGIANGVFIVAVNRVGREGKLNFWGASFVSDPMGRVLAKASQDQAENLLVSIDLSQVEKTRQEWPFLRDRRIDAYEGLTCRYLDE